MIVTQLFTAMGDYLIKESVADILEQKKGLGETEDLMFTILNTKEEGHEGYKGSCLAALYRSVREAELPNRKTNAELEEKGE